MKIFEALNILEPVAATLRAIKKARSAFALKYHPDVNPEGLEMMKLGNVAYDVLLNNMDYVEREWAKLNNEASQYENIAVEIEAIFKKIRHFAGIHAEVCGTWLWVSGNTRTYKEQLNNFGFRWAPKKKKWSWHPESYTRRHRKGEWDMSKIRDTWGSVDLETEELHAVA